MNDNLKIMEKSSQKLIRTSSPVSNPFANLLSEVKTNLANLHSEVKINLKPESYKKGKNNFVLEMDPNIDRHSNTSEQTI